MRMQAGSLAIITRWAQLMSLSLVTAGGQCNASMEQGMSSMGDAAVGRLD